MPSTRRIAAHSVAGLALAAIVGVALAQAPKPTPIEEQIRLFNSLTPEQQRALIREVQQNLPPEQAEKIIKVLQGGSQAPTELRPVDTPVN